MVNAAPAERRVLIDPIDLPRVNIWKQKSTTVIDPGMKAILVFVLCVISRQYMGVLL